MDVFEDDGNDGRYKDNKTELSLHLNYLLFSLSLGPMIMVCVRG